MWADWLVFRACGFQSVCPLMEKDKRLMEASWWGRLRRKLGLVLMDKSLIPFSVERQGCVPWGQTMVEVRKIMTTSFKKSHACTATLSAPNPAAGHRQSMPPLETPGHSRASLGQSLVGSLLLSPRSWCAKGSVCALPESVSPVLCKSWQFCGGLIATYSKRAYVVPRSSTARALRLNSLRQWLIKPKA